MFFRRILASLLMFMAVSATAGQSLFEGRESKSLAKVAVPETKTQRDQRTVSDMLQLVVVVPQSLLRWSSTS
jgi:hypothetical protein